MDVRLSEILFFLLGIFVPIIIKLLHDYLNKKHYIISWKDFFKTLISDDFKAYITNHENKPDIIIGLNNGIVPAAIIATNIGVDDLYYYHMFPCKDDNDCREYPNIKKSFIDLNNKKVLLVDDQSYTGKSMDALYQHLRSMNGFDKNKVKRFAVYEYISPINKIPLDIKAPGKIKGAIKQVPWSFTDEHRIASRHDKK